jgi:hypothetical protein
MPATATVFKLGMATLGDTTQIGLDLFVVLCSKG